MPSFQSYPHALFSLVAVPGNKEANHIINHPNNAYLVSKLPGGKLGLGIDFSSPSKLPKARVTLEQRLFANIFIEGANISKDQCYFEIHFPTSIVMLHDTSSNKSTQVFGENAVPFGDGRERKILVQKDLNTVIGLGGMGQDLIQFRLEWHNDPAKLYANQKVLSAAWGVGPNTPSPWLKMRYVKEETIGSGGFGTVHKAINVDSGTRMAVKVLHKVEGNWKREVKFLSTLSHPHIVEHISWQYSQVSNKLTVEIFMGLKEGSLTSLVKRKPLTSSEADLLLHQMLEALDYLASKGIAHRDVKPANILYTTQQDGQHRFYLGDFGLCNMVNHANSIVGTDRYIAPEIFEQVYQTDKVDVWSLFVTMQSVLPVNKFTRNLNKAKGYGQIKQAVLDAAESNDVLGIREMAIVNPAQRASAAQMLVNRYNGQGLSTPRHQVPALTSNHIFN